MPPDSATRPTTPGREPETKQTSEPQRHWMPIYDEFRLSLPVAWQCPCSGLVHTASGRISCPECGRIPRDGGNNGIPDEIKQRWARRFVKGGR
jgi:hypothetical protein